MSKGHNARHVDKFSADEQMGKAGRTVESRDVSLFAGLSGDFNPIHINEVHAKLSTFASRIARGLLTFAIRSTARGLSAGATIGFLGLDEVLRRAHGIGELFPQAVSSCSGNVANSTNRSMCKAVTLVV